MGHLKLYNIFQEIKSLGIPLINSLESIYVRSLITNEIFEKENIYTLYDVKNNFWYFYLASDLNFENIVWLVPREWFKFINIVPKGSFDSLPNDEYIKELINDLIKKRRYRHIEKGIK